jgi:general secretion pathway protein K
MSTASIQLWRMAKIDCHMLEGMVPEVTEKGGLAPLAKNKKFEFDDENPELGKEMQAKKFGSFTGCFDTVITDEEERINLNKLDGTQLVAVRHVAGQLVTTLNDKRYEFLFEKEDANRLKIPANEIIIGMKDWIDEDETALEPEPARARATRSSVASLTRTATIRTTRPATARRTPASTASTRSSSCTA